MCTRSARAAVLIPASSENAKDLLINFGQILHIYSPLNLNTE